jgi:hypothetical protein
VGGEGDGAGVKYLGWALAAALVLLTLRDFARNWQGNEIASHPDEAAHYVTGVMVYEYLRGHIGENPLAFAEQFYARYPKVAIGHWPPGYYAMQAVWFAVAGPGIWQAHALNWLLALAFLGVWWWALQRTLGGAVALASGAWVLSLPVLQRCAAMVLSDGGVVLWAWVAGALWVLRGPGWALVAAASLAILTKGTAWMILPALVTAPLLSGEWRKIAWREALAIVGFSAPFYLWVKQSGLSYPLRNVTESNWISVIPKRWNLMGEFWDAAPWTLWLLALAGTIAGAMFATGVLRRWWAFSVSLTMSTLLFLWISGFSFEHRALAVALPFLGVLAILPLAIWPQSPLRYAVATLLVLRAPVDVDAVKGFRGAAEALPGDARAVLVVSDSVGEGAFVAQVLERDKARERVVLRGSRMLSQQDWNGLGVSMRFDGTSDLQSAIDAAPVQYVLLDSVNELAYAKRLRELSREWRLIERRRVKQRVLELFALPANLGKPLQTFSLELGLERGGRKITYRPGPL